MKPICVNCQRFYRIKQTGMYFIEGYPKHNHSPPGKAAPEDWQPYKLWAGDLFECDGCGSQTIVGVGCNQIAEHYQFGFADTVKACNATFQVNDC
jgi:hypothetical protein